MTHKYTPGPDEEGFYTREPFYTVEMIRDIVEQEGLQPESLLSFEDADDEHLDSEHEPLSAEEQAKFNARISGLLPVELRESMAQGVAETRERSFDILEWFGTKGHYGTVKPLIDKLEEIDPKEKPLESDLVAVARDIFEARAAIDTSAPNSHSEYTRLTILGELAHNVSVAATIKCGMQDGHADHDVIRDAHRLNIQAHYDVALKDLYGRALEDRTI